MPVREMTEADLPQVLAIQQQLGFQEWNEREFIAEIRASYALCVVFEQTNSIVERTGRIQIRTEMAWGYT